uniref:Uncharacterized protein n=1 Tax=Arundo donax TaxID=35708 RepID=A0A0A8YDE5_ARUDO
MHNNLITAVHVNLINMEEINKALLSQVVP